MVTDGKQSHSREVRFVVAPAAEGQVTALSSRVLDASAFAQGQIRSHPGGQGHRGGLDGHGHFRRQRELYTAEYPPRKTGRGPQWPVASPQVTAAPLQTIRGFFPLWKTSSTAPIGIILLPKIDSAGMAMVSPASRTTINNTNIGVSLTVPPRTAMGGDGQAYSAAPLGVRGSH